MFSLGTQDGLGSWCGWDDPEEILGEGGGRVQVGNSCSFMADSNDKCMARAIQSL